MKEIENLVIDISFNVTPQMTIDGRKSNYCFDEIEIDVLKFL